MRRLWGGRARGAHKLLHVRNATSTQTRVSRSPFHGTGVLLAAPDSFARRATPWMPQRYKRRLSQTSCRRERRRRGDPAQPLARARLLGTREQAAGQGRAGQGQYYPGDIQAIA